MRELSSQELMSICDRYWELLSSPSAREVAKPFEHDYARYVHALNELATRGPETLDWARRLLTHPDYDARETGAFLLGQLGNRGLLGSLKGAVIAELGALSQRPIEEDGKEAQAIDSAIMALGEIGDPSVIPHLRAVMFSNRPEHDGDTLWTAAEVLGSLVGEPFVDAPDRVAAAREWLRAHPDD